jgi:5-(carboxyamino)imidazole ribonucleotide synthase
MLAMAAARLSYRVIVLEPQADCPAAQVANDQIVAAYDDPRAIAELAARCDVVTYEFENVPVSAAHAPRGTDPAVSSGASSGSCAGPCAEKTFLNSHRRRDHGALFCD